MSHVTCPYIICRKCADHPASNELHPEDRQGFSPRIVVDLHKFLAMAKIMKGEEEGGIWNVADLEGLKAVAGMGNSTSPRINVLIRSSTQLRTGIR